MTRFFTADVSQPMTEHEVSLSKPNSNPEDWDRPEKGLWASTKAMSFGLTITITRPVKAKHFYQCPNCFAMFIRRKRPVALCGKGKRLTLVPLSSENKPEGLILWDIDLKAAYEFSRTCNCDTPLTSITSYEKLGEAFDFLSIQTSDFEY